MLHGFPQTHVCWHKIAQRLAERFTVVITDLRGYGASSKPEGGPHHVNYSKRSMARDQVLTMSALGFERFHLAGHDRGGRVAHRLALDYPERVLGLAVLDIAPTATMYAAAAGISQRPITTGSFSFNPSTCPNASSVRKPSISCARPSAAGASATARSPKRPWMHISRHSRLRAPYMPPARTIVLRPPLISSTTTRTTSRRIGSWPPCSSCGEAEGRWGASSTCSRAGEKNQAASYKVRHSIVDTSFPRRRRRRRSRRFYGSLPVDIELTTASGPDRPVSPTHMIVRYQG